VIRNYRRYEIVYSYLPILVTAVSMVVLFACGICSGNWVGQKPYTKGLACSKCETGAGWCTDGLCNRTYRSCSLEQNDSDFFCQRICNRIHCARSWPEGGVVQWLGRRYLAGRLSPTDGWQVTTLWINCPLWVSQLGQLSSLPSFRDR